MDSTIHAPFPAQDGDGISTPKSSYPAMFARFGVNGNSYRSILKPKPREPSTTWSSFSIDIEPDQIGSSILHRPRSAAVANAGVGG